MSLLMGMVVALAILFVSFEWGTQDVKLLVNDRDGGIEWVDEIPITMQEPTPPPPPPPATVVADIINVLEDDIIIDGPGISGTEDDPNAGQTETYTPPVVTDEEEEDVNKVFVIVEEAPLFPGGEGELLKFISKSIKYPVVDQENGIQGRVVCAFVVNRDGSVVDAEVIRGVSPTLDREALRVISGMPRWTPGKQRGKPVRVKYTVPITFRLQ